MHVVAEVVRNGLVESRHHGVVVRVAPSGEVAWSVGDPSTVIYPRSANKPFQAAAMVRAGLDLPPHLTALSTASHSGEEFHLEGVREILGLVGLDEFALQCPASYPYDPKTRTAYIRAGNEPAPIAMDCSGKHAAMLWVCVKRGWDTETYLEPEHPLQQVVAETHQDITGAPIAVSGIDGCGAPQLATSLHALTRGFGRMVQAPRGSAEARVVQAILAHPEQVSGTRRDERALIEAFPGAIAKSGAEAVYVVALADGTAFGLKIADGSDRARAVVMAQALKVAGHEHALLDEVPIVLGGGKPVGEIRPTLTADTVV